MWNINITHGQKNMLILANKLIVLVFISSSSIYAAPTTTTPWHIWCLGTIHIDIREQNYNVCYKRWEMQCFFFFWLAVYMMPFAFWKHYLHKIVVLVNLHAKNITLDLCASPVEQIVVNMFHFGEKQKFVFIVIYYIWCLYGFWW